MVVQDQVEYEELLSHWSDLESGLGVILANPNSTQQFAHRVRQYDRWMQGLMHRDPDAGLYLLFQLAGNSPVGYSASHALVCSVLCHLIARELKLSSKDRDSLVHAALTMNIAMTKLQDELANRAEKPTPEQQIAIRAHPIKGAMMLTNLGVSDDDWLSIVSSHHDEAVNRADAHMEPATQQLCHILQMVDRYAAMISPRVSRSGRTATESARNILARASGKADDNIGKALVRAVGLCPPGTYVRLDNDDLAVVVRRSLKPNHPYVAILGKSNGELLAHPRLHRTADGSPHIRSALSALSVRAQINHLHILHLGAYATQPG